MFGLAMVDQKSSVDPDRLIRDCGLLFFSTSLVATFGVDFAFGRRTSNRLLGDLGLFILFPLIIIVISIFVYTECSVGEPNLLAIIIIQLGVTFATCVYAFAVKRIQFRRRFPT
jgi:hypothetical protein